jgi:hypothetical protein
MVAISGNKVVKPTVAARLSEISMSNSIFEPFFEFLLKQITIAKKSVLVN